MKGQACIKSMELKRKIKEAMQNVFGDLVEEIKTKRDETVEKFNSLEKEVEDVCDNLAITICDIIEEEKTDLVGLLKKSGINSKQKAIDRLQRE